MSLTGKHKGKTALITPANTEALKGAAILLVVLCHITATLGIGNYTHGDSGVDIFLILSGYGLTLSLREESFLSFMRRRLMRIAPSYWLAILLIVPLNRWILNDPFNLEDVVTHLLFIHTFFKGDFSSLNIAWWFLGLIVPLYALFYFLKPLIKSNKSGLILLISVSITIASYVIIPSETPGYFSHYLLRIPSFFIGILAGMRSNDVNAFTEKNNQFWLGISNLLYFFFFITADHAFIYVPVFGVILTLGFLCLFETVNLFKKAFIWLGVYSYEIYLLHLNFIQEYNLHFLSKIVANPLEHPALITAGILIGLVVSTSLAIGLKKLSTQHL
jgi:peptidoglycan/LPS O-acetylase OafA/YrhL